MILKYCACYADPFIQPDLHCTYNTTNKTNCSGARKGFLKSAARLETDALRDLKNAWKKLTSNDSNDAMVLNQGITFEPAASTAVENQMNENKKTNSDLIFNVFGLSPEIYSKDDVFLQGIKTGDIFVFQRIIHCSQYDCVFAQYSDAPCTVVSSAAMLI